MPSLPSCRILAISSSASQARELIDRVIASSDSAIEERLLLTSEDAHFLPWTISNKYYMAPVHFSLAQTTEVKGEDVMDVPACIFIFSLAEPFKDEFSSLVSRLESSDFEVSIAVSVPSSGSEQPQTTDEEQDTLEEFFGENGFEYVQDHFSRDQTTHGYEIDDVDNMPGIRRIIDALSTILWPSMVQKSGSRRAKTRSVISVPGPPAEEEGLRSLLGVDQKPAGEADTNRQREMAALEKWLEEGADEETDPWAGMPQSSLQTQSNSAPHPPESGFDDNFSDFVSAPARLHDSDNDPALPSREEVEATCRRIFDSALSEDPDDNDMQSPFDLSHVLGALEAMKEEIASITDEDEKRKAAAKVALGLVYGLDDG